jgi:hypothetical protein
MANSGVACVDRPPQDQKGLHKEAFFCFKWKKNPDPGFAGVENEGVVAAPNGSAARAGANR